MNSITIFSLFAICLLLASCDHSMDSTEGTRTEGEFKVAEVDSMQIVLFETANLPNDEELSNQLKIILNESKFSIEDSKIGNRYVMSFDDCVNKITYSIEGEGIQWYYVKRQEAKPENYYPDFAIYVFEFESERVAEEVFSKIKNTKSSLDCSSSIKEIMSLSKNGNRVFYLTTRAEMFRGYINEFSLAIETME